MIEINKEDLLKDAVYETLSQKEIETKLKSNFSSYMENPDKEIEIEVSEPLLHKLKNENTLIYVLLTLILILVVITIYIW